MNLVARLVWMIFKRLRHIQALLLPMVFIRMTMIPCGELVRFDLGFAIRQKFAFCPTREFIKGIFERLKIMKKLFTLAALSPLPAFAAVPVAVTDAITAMQTDGVTVATAFLVAFFTIYAIQYLRRTK